MAVCIICREEKQNFSIEHVIPGSINGYYTINSICVDCNSFMGSRIDIELINLAAVQFKRLELGIKGNSGKIPNQLIGSVTSDDFPNEKLVTRLDENGKIIVTQMSPKVEIQERDGIIKISLYLFL